MKTPFKFTMPNSLDALSAAPVSTGKLTKRVVGPGSRILKKSLGQLTRHLTAHPGDEATLSAVCMALSDGADVEEVIAILESYSSAHEDSGLTDYTTADLAFRIAQKSSHAHARELCRLALDMCPVHVAALSLFEKVMDASDSDELCARYQIFIEDAPSHAVAPEVCKSIASKLLRAEGEATRPGHLEDVPAASAPLAQELCNAILTAGARYVSEVESVTERCSIAAMVAQA